MPDPHDGREGRWWLFDVDGGTLLFTPFAGADTIRVSRAAWLNPGVHVAKRGVARVSRILCWGAWTLVLEVDIVRAAGRYREQSSGSVAMRWECLRERMAVHHRDGANDGMRRWASSQPVGYALRCYEPEVGPPAPPRYY